MRLLTHKGGGLGVNGQGMTQPLNKYLNLQDWDTLMENVQRQQKLPSH